MNKLILMLLGCTFSVQSNLLFAGDFEYLVIAAFLSEAGYISGHFTHASRMDIENGIKMMQKELAHKVTGRLDPLSREQLFSITLQQKTKQNLNHIDKQREKQNRVIFSAQEQVDIANLLYEKHYLEALEKYLFKDNIELKQLLKQLDPYSEYYFEAQKNYFLRRQLASQMGLGVNILLAKKILLVPLANGPLAKSGLTSPAYLKTIQRKKIIANEFSSYAYLASLQQDKVLDVAVYDHLNPQQTKVYHVLVAEFDNLSIENVLLENKAVIRIHRFGEGNTEILKRLLHEKIAHNQPIIIDLRYCPGGDLFEVVDAVSLFIGNNKQVLSLRHRQKRDDLYSIDHQILSGQRVTIWMGEYTASAAEIFIRILHHQYKNLVTIGTATQGKCLAQKNIPLSRGLLKLTTEEIFIAGKSCHNQPFNPQFEVKAEHSLQDKYYINLQK